MHLEMNTCLKLLEVPQPPVEHFLLENPSINLPNMKADSVSYMESHAQQFQLHGMHWRPDMKTLFQLGVTEESMHRISGLSQRQQEVVFFTQHQFRAGIKESGEMFVDLGMTLEHARTRSHPKQVPEITPNTIVWMVERGRLMSADEAYALVVGATGEADPLRAYGVAQSGYLRAAFLLAGLSFL